MPQPRPKRLKVEKVGGFAGFGGPNLKSEGEVELAGLPEGERDAVEKLLAGAKDAAADSMLAGISSAPSPDGFRYRLSWDDEDGSHCVEVGEGELPESVRAAARDRLD